VTSVTNQALMPPVRHLEQTMDRFLLQDCCRLKVIS